MSTSGFTDAERGAFLNQVLETERAGARALVVFLEEHERQGEAWKILRQVQADEAHNCALVGKLLDRAGVAHSHVTGGFYGKAVAVSGRRERIEFLLRGLGWAVREFDQAMTRVDDLETRDTLARMRESHVRSIEACAGIVRRLGG